MLIPPSASTPNDAADPVSGSVAPRVHPLPDALLPVPVVLLAFELELEPELEHAATVARTVRPAIASQNLRG
jgi:hypothetical protein